MNAAAQSALAAAPDIVNLLDLARDRSSTGRATLVDAVGNMFLARDGGLSDRESALISEILCKLLDDVEASVRQTLAERLSDRGDAPRELIVQLANDEIAVARPLLIDSPLLDEPDLIEIVRHRSREHQLAVAVRSGIGATVSDALIATGDGGVIKSLLENESATISQLAFEYLVEQARRTDEFHEPLIDHRALPTDLASKVYWWVSANLRDRIVGKFELDPMALDETLQLAVRDMIAEADDQAGAGKANELVEHLSRSNALDSKLLIQVLREGEIPLFEAMYAKITGLPDATIKTLLYEPGGEQLAVASKAARISKPDFASIFLLSRQGRPGDQTVDPEELSKVLAYYDNLSAEVAKNAVRNWRLDLEVAVASGTPNAIG
ncbi:MAG: DUF2336 domain-containing protein [Alphaproteobacteria bacterium]|nr:DUF2336 domain-containing protein [Alphaproteobacteria bacterium]